MLTPEQAAEMANQLKEFDAPRVLAFCDAFDSLVAAAELVSSECPVASNGRAMVESAFKNIGAYGPAVSNIRAKYSSGSTVA